MTIAEIIKRNHGGKSLPIVEKLVEENAIFKIGRASCRERV